jgi:tetratricopeptide (TPR) repeat protein
MYRWVAKKLALDRSRVLVIPGNHDVNRKACEAYFNTCAADDGRRPAPPFFPKWNAFVDFFKRFYVDQPQYQFTEAAPYTFFEISDLCLVVAGLNSTISESHQDDDHYGSLGEPQLRAFQKWLAPFRQRGWLRIGLVHHNIARGAVADDENLRDTDDLKRILGPELNLLLHGHTHEARIGWLGSSLPVLSTGSAAVTSQYRPSNGEVPNQYQVIRISADRLWLGTRQYVPDQRRWVGDSRVSDHGDAWYREERIAFMNAQATFHTGPLGLTSARPADTPAETLRQATRLREKGATSQALEAATAAALTFDASSDRQGQIEARVERTKICIQMGDMSSARLSLEEAKAILAEGMPDLEARVLNVAGHLEHRSANQPQAEECFRDALRIGQSIPDCGVTGQAYFGLGNVCRVTGRHQDARTNYKLAEEMFRQSQEKRWQAAALRAMGTLEYSQDNVPLASGLLLRAQELSRAEGDSLEEARALIVRGHIARESGSLDNARGIYREAAREAGKAGARHELAHAKLGLAAASAHDAVAQAVAAFREAREIYASVADRLGEANSLNGLGESLRKVPALDEAASAFESALELGRATKNPRAECNALLGLGEVAGDRGHDVEAQQRLTEASEQYEKLGERRGAADAYLAAARNHARHGRSEADAYYERALRAYRSVMDRVGEAECLLAFGEYCSTRDVEYARQLLYQGALLLEHAGSARRAQAAVKQARGLGQLP